MKVQSQELKEAQKSNSPFRMKNKSLTGQEIWFHLKEVRQTLTAKVWTIFLLFLIHISILWNIISYFLKGLNVSWNEVNLA